MSKKRRPKARLAPLVLKRVPAADQAPTQTAPATSTLVDRFTQSAKDHPLVARVIIVGIVFLAVTGLIESGSKLVSIARSVYSIAFPPPTDAKQKRDRALDAISEYLGVAKNQVGLETVHWLDLVGKGGDNEFYCTYTCGGREYAGVYSCRGQCPQRLLHTEDGEDICHAVLGGTNYQFWAEPTTS